MKKLRKKVRQKESKSKRKKKEEKEINRDFQLQKTDNKHTWLVYISLEIRKIPPL